MKRQRIFCFAVVLLFSSHSLSAVPVEQTDNHFTYRAEHGIADGNTESSATFIILHGTLAHNKMEIIEQLSEQLLDNGYNTLAINLSLSVNARHSSSYDCTIPHRHSHYDAVDEISRWVNWLVKKKVTRIIPVGHSRGGNQIALYMQNAPNFILRYILFAPATWNFQKTKSHYKSNLDMLLNTARKMIKHGLGERLINNIPFLYCDNASASAVAFESYYADDAKKNTPRVLANTKNPVLVFSGDRDRVVPDLDGLVFKYASNNENVQLIGIKNADHYFRDLYMDDAVDHIMEFIE